MTQTNNERDDLISRKDLLELIYPHVVSDKKGNWALTKPIIEAITSAPPISQNEQQEAVAYGYERATEISEGVKQNKYGGWERKLSFDKPKNHPSFRNVYPLYTSPPKQAIPEGWKLVPIEPTDEMLKAGIDMADYEGFAPPYLTYEAMINAAPTNTE